ncbi:MAG: response regulator, partial [Proteobacteria bacterium]|nr:response regulator [Pseudomonadota bacterium]
VIIDRRKSNCTSLQEQLSAYGANCFLANTMDEAIRILKDNTKHDVYIIDSEILFRDGKIEQEISSLVQAEKIILSVNPKDINEYSTLAKANHINRTLIKPIKRKEMLHDVNGILNPSRVKKNDHNETYSDVNEAEAKHILLVEDNPDNRMLIKAYLKKTAHTLDEAENGEIAVEMYKQNNYDLVLMDVQMPVMDGHEATRLIRDWETEQNKERVTIISLTAHAIREEIDKCMAAGCDKHISKPVKKATLLQTISETV